MKKLNTRALRLRLGINQKEFWQRCGITQSGGSRYEHGRAVPVPTQMILIIAYGTAIEAQRIIDMLRGGG